MVLWRSNLMAPWPQEPGGYLELMEKIWAGVDSLIKKGLVKEVGTFLDGMSGYTIVEGEAAEVYNAIGMFIPYTLCEVHEIMPYEKGKEIDRARLKALIEATTR